MKRLGSLVAACVSSALLSACSGSANMGAPTAGGGMGSSPSGLAHALTNTRPPTTQGKVVYAFQGGTDGANPWATLLAGKGGTFFGTTYLGGEGTSGQKGTAFMLSAAGAETIIHTFQGGADGANPFAGLIAGKRGVLYGDSLYGGDAAQCSIGCGTVFELDPNGSGFGERVLYAFLGGTDGAIPEGNLLMDKSGALYGTTGQGGTGGSPCIGGCGTVFKLTPSGSGYTESVLYSFQGGSDGLGPQASLIGDSAGALYGTTSGGGGAAACPRGCGTVFKLTPSGSTYSESVLYRFQGGVSDGKFPRCALLAKKGTLYGVTPEGGPKGRGNGFGTVFELTPSRSGYAERVLYYFKGGGDGAFPTDEGGLYADKAGALYGTTEEGGGATGCKGGCGTVFKLTPSASSYSESVAYPFQGGQDGADPNGSVIADKFGTLYGTTNLGGGATACKHGCGTVFKLMP
jgi:uncharacterized repeat protein (TIGR03803 family)